ncbi:Zinc finger protein [Trichinella nelsoni]|uniref:Zinc finger protein n=1 Tax=Trichinella nelsoni TaxID=6336 RepID=A0A0V0RLE2_9BILA|nr:Zinc finger protein [Trichinella nelsoni]
MFRKLMKKLLYQCGNSFHSEIFLISVKFDLRQMARGQQKLQSQQRNLKKQQEAKKGSAVDHKKAAQKGLIYQCVVCRSQMPDLKTYGQHFENKHPKSSKPPELLAESTNSSAS